MPVSQVIGEMEDLTKAFPFQIPSYFALILRAFSVIEGIALRADPTYAIVPECFPYMSRRLFTDNSPRVKAALQQMLYGVIPPFISPKYSLFVRVFHAPSLEPPRRHSSP